MSAAETLLEVQSAALLRRLERERDSRVRRAREDAGSQANELMRRARAEARARMREAVLEIRRAERTALAGRRAAIDTQRRRTQQARLRSLLDDAWRELPAALVARWSDPVAREDWCRAACNEAARRLLPAGDMSIEVEAADANSVGPIAQRNLAPHGVDRVTVTATAGVGAGLRIRAGDACLDATSDGLLASRERVAAELLAELERQLESRRSSSTG